MTSVLIVLSIAVASFVISTIGFFLTIAMMRNHAHSKPHSKS